MNDDSWDYDDLSFLDVDCAVNLKSNEEIWFDQLENMDISIIEKFLRKKKLQNINNVD